MNVKDRDFDLSHEQLIKCCRILLHKVNYLTKKTALENGELASMINKRVEKVENVTKASLTEANSFLHVIHEDFEQFLKKHKKEHSALNLRLIKVTEDVAKAVTLVSPI